MKKLDVDSEQIIQRHGWAVQSVFADPEADEPSFSYSIGLCQKGLPELIVLGLPHPLASELLHILARRLMDMGQDYKSLVGIVDVGFNVPVFLHPCRAEDVKDYALRAIHRGGPKISFLQVCFPNPQGKFAWEVGFEGHPKLYRILGEPVAVTRH